MMNPPARGVTLYFESHTTPNPGVCVNAFFLTTGPWSSYSTIFGAGLSSCCLSLIHESPPCGTNYIDTFRNKTLSKKKKKKKKYDPSQT